MSRPGPRPSSPNRGAAIRAFVAVPLPEEIRAELRRVQHGLSDCLPHRSVRWVRPEGIHLTIKFLGDTPISRLPAVDAALEAVARNAWAFTASIGGAGCFPNSYRPRVIWVGVAEPQGWLASIHAAVEEALESVGFTPEGRGFTPHLTLGRVDRGATRAQAALVGEVVAGSAVGDLGQVRVTHLNLIRSVLKPGGAEYSTLGEFALRAA